MIIDKKIGLKSIKGQFFIISAVIMVSMFLVIGSGFLDFNSIDLTRQAEMNEYEYISMIKKSLNNSASTECDRQEEEIRTIESFLSRNLAEQGIELSVEHQIVSCGKVKFKFNLTSPGFFSSTEFWYP